MKIYIIALIGLLLIASHGLNSETWINENSNNSLTVETNKINDGIVSMDYCFVFQEGEFINCSDGVAGFKMKKTSNVDNCYESSSIVNYYEGSSHNVSLCFLDDKKLIWSSKDGSNWFLVDISFDLMIKDQI